SSSTTSSNGKFYYAVQNGRVPGVYTDWPSAQAQIKGWTKPKHRRFATRSEAEAFVADRSNGTTEARKSPATKLLAAAGTKGNAAMPPAKKQKKQSDVVN